MQEHATNALDYADRLINEQVAANFLGFSVRALQNWRVRGGGPEYVRVSKRSVRYRRRDLIAWAEGRLEPHTSAPPRPRAEESHAPEPSADAARAPVPSPERQPQAERAAEGQKVAPAPERRMKTPLEALSDWANPR